MVDAIEPRRSTGQSPHANLAPLLPAGEAVETLLRKAQYFTAGTPTADHREVHRDGGRGAEEFYSIGPLCKHFQMRSVDQREKPSNQ